MRVLVTGASGRLGPFVVAELEGAGHELVLMSRRRPAAADRWPWVQGDITDFAACRKATEGVEAIQHLAAQPGPTDHPAMRKQAEERGLPFDQTMRSNTLGTYYLLRAAVERGIRTFVMTGSNCALGHGFRISQRAFPFQYLPVDEKHPSDVEDSYSYSKLAGEELLASYTRAYGMRTHVVRAAGITPPQRRAEMAARIGPARGWNPWLWPWVGSEDVASAHRLLMERADEIEPHGVYFCNADDSTALEPTMELLERFKPELVPLARGITGHQSLISNARLRQTVGWEHKTSWRTASSQT
ncbi:MAG TPA: NAD(P)-dependent oxidoreductase [Planctomycetota bacterium]|nr:NAD(P)-dependent oxidoreductase [Planctomycetota bacterium]